MKTSIEILFTLFAEYTGQSLSSEAASPFSRSAPIKQECFDAYGLVMALEVSGDSTALTGSKPNQTYIRRRATLKVSRNNEPLSEKVEFLLKLMRKEPYLSISAIEYGQTDRPSLLTVTHGTVEILPDDSNLLWVPLCQEIESRAYHLVKLEQQELYEVSSGSALP